MIGNCNVLTGIEIVMFAVLLLVQEKSNIALTACSSASLCVQTVQGTVSGKAEEVTAMTTGRTKWGRSRCPGGWGDPRDLFASPPSRLRPNILSWWWSTTTKWWVKDTFCCWLCGRPSRLTVGLWPRHMKRKAAGEERVKTWTSPYRH